MTYYYSLFAFNVITYVHFAIEGESGLEHLINLS